MTITVADIDAELGRRDPVRWAEANFYIPETSETIELLPHQAAVLRHVLKPDPDTGQLPYTTIVWSTPKKSGKTTIAGVVGRWIAETWGPYQLVMCVGNDAGQAKERVFAAVVQSIELAPGYNRARRDLPGRWHLQDAEAHQLANGSIIKAIATDYEGEAGANPTITIWTELWGFRHRADLRFWAEMAPSPIRTNSIRWVETYAGYEGESELLWGLYQTGVLEGRQLTAGELGALGAFEEAPNPDSLIPCWVDDAAGVFVYWDSGDVSLRMPWQQGPRGQKYYQSEATTQTPSQFSRIHRNLWISGETNFVPMEWWDACTNPLPLRTGETTPMILALDAAVTDDCFGLVAVSRNPDAPADQVAVRLIRKWDPPPGGSIDYADAEAVVRAFCRDFNVIEVAYDTYQLHDFATRLTKDGVAWFRPFGQGQERMVADKGLYDLIVQRRFRHDGNLDLREHISNSNAKHSKDEDNKLRLVKKSQNRKIDLAVATSMASAECLRLML